MGSFFKDLANSATNAALTGVTNGLRQGLANAIMGISDPLQYNDVDRLLKLQARDTEKIKDLVDFADDSVGRNYDGTADFSGATSEFHEIGSKSQNDKYNKDPLQAEDIRKQVKTETVHKNQEIVNYRMEDKQLLFKFPDWTYADWINERSMWQRGISSFMSERGWFYFKIFFDFKTQHGLFGGVLNDSNDLHGSVNSAMKFLWTARNYYGHENLNERIVALKKFVSILSNIQSNTPWFFKSFKGLDKIPHPTKDYTKEKFVTINCSEESVDMRVSTMLDLYRFAAYDDILNKEIIPENLRKFDMSIVVFNTPIKNYHTSFTHKSNQFLNAEKFNYKGLINTHGNGVFNDIMTYKMYTLKNCEIDLETYNLSQPTDLNNEAPFNFKPAIQIKYDKLYIHTSNEFAGMLFGPDGIYYNQYKNYTHEDAYNLYDINKIRDNVIQEKRYKALKKALTSTWYNPSNEHYKSLIDASEMISHQIIHHTQTREKNTKSLAQNFLLKALKLGAYVNPYTNGRWGNLHNDGGIGFGPGTQYFNNKLMLLKNGELNNSTTSYVRQYKEAYKNALADAFGFNEGSFWRGNYSPRKPHNHSNGREQNSNLNKAKEWNWIYPLKPEIPHQHKLLLDKDGNEIILKNPNGSEITHGMLDYWKDLHQNILGSNNSGDFSPSKWSSKDIFKDAKYKYDEKNNPHQAPLTPSKPHIHKLLLDKDGNEIILKNPDGTEITHGVLDYWKTLHQNIRNDKSLGDFSPRKWSSKTIFKDAKYKYDEENNSHQAPLTPAKPHIHTKKTAEESPHNLLDYWDDLHQNILKTNSSGDFSPKK